MSADAAVRRTAVQWRAGALMATGLLLATLAGASLAGRPARAAGDCTVSSAEAAMDGDEMQALSMVNAHRQMNGKTPLAVSSTLSRAAAWKARDFGTRTFQGNEDPHVDTLGRLPHAMNKDCGFSGTITGENMGFGYATPQAIVEAWKQSAAHNANMLRDFFSAAGIGRFESPSYGTIWFIELGNALDSGAPPPASQPVTTPAPTPVSFPQATPLRTPTPNSVTTTNTTPTTQATQAGTVTFRVSLVNAAGQLVIGDLSGHSFTLTGAGMYTTAPTDAQGQASIAVPVGSYSVSARMKAGTELRSFSTSGTTSASVAVGAGQAVTIAVTGQLTAATTPQATASPAGSGQTTTAAPAAATTTTTIMQTIALPSGCSNVALTWPPGTPMSTVLASFSTPGAVMAVWRYNAETGTFVGFAPNAAAVSDYKAIARPLEAAFVCLSAPASLNRPATG
jgi:uncharacterized protein YkwD